MQLLAGLALSLVIAYAARRAGSLTSDGAVAAVPVGTIVFGLGGWKWAVLLLLFFVSSSLLSQLLPRHDEDAAGRSAKGSRRDAGQVLGNVAVAVACVVAHNALPGTSWPGFAYAAALAAVTADTWATELGALSPSLPRSITHLDIPVRPGTSGGVTLFGTLAALAGAGLIRAAAGVLLPMPVGWAAVIILLGGLAAALFDSVLGATVQTMYFCATDNLETEQHPRHRCGSPTTYARGWRWLNNDLVNTTCSAFGSLATCALALALSLL